jgi:hypothetical protein
MGKKLPPAPTGRGHATFLLIADLWEQLELAKWLSRWSRNPMTRC